MWGPLRSLSCATIPRARYQKASRHRLPRDSRLGCGGKRADVDPVGWACPRRIRCGHVKPPVAGCRGTVAEELTSPRLERKSGSRSKVTPVAAQQTVGNFASISIGAIKQSDPHCWTDLAKCPSHNAQQSGETSCYGLRKKPRAALRDWEPPEP